MTEYLVMAVAAGWETVSELDAETLLEIGNLVYYLRSLSSISALHHVAPTASFSNSFLNPMSKISLDPVAD